MLVIGACWQFLFLEYLLASMNKEEYLSFFSTAHPEQKKQRGEAKPRQAARPKTSHYCLSKTKKLLPHIIEEYQYRITNQLLAEKITHPKRDKLITESFSNLHNKRQNADKKKTLLRAKAEEKENQQSKSTPKREAAASGESLHLKRGGKSCQIQRLYKTFDNLNSSCFNYKNDYLISLQNNRMGKRIINTRSMVQDILTKTYYTYQIYNGKIVNRDRYLHINRNSVKFRNCNKNFGKINNGIKCFFEHTVAEDDKQPTHARHATASRAQTFHERSMSRIKESSHHATMDHHGYETNNPAVLETYGEGDLNFVVNQLFIDSNPPLKSDTILILQVIEKDQKLSHVLNSYYAEKNNFVNQICATELSSEDYASKDCYTTASFPYQYIATESKTNFGLKFRFHYRSHIFLRILRAEGLEQRELGVVRLDLQPFRTRVAEEFPFRIIKQIREINGVNYCRQIFESEFKGNLYRFKKGEISTTVRFSYQLYFRSFKLYEDKEKDDAQQQDMPE